MLLPTQDGPFTLYREASCRIELEVELPRDLVKSKAVPRTDRISPVGIKSSSLGV